MVHRQTTRSQGKAKDHILPHSHLRELRCEAAQDAVLDFQGEFSTPAPQLTTRCSLVLQSLGPGLSSNRGVYSTTTSH